MKNMKGFIEELLLTILLIILMIILCRLSREDTEDKEEDKTPITIISDSLVGKKQ